MDNIVVFWFKTEEKSIQTYLEIGFNFLSRHFLNVFGDFLKWENAKVFTKRLILKKWIVILIYARSKVPKKRILYVFRWEMNTY